MSDGIRGQDWSESDVALCVDAYFQYLNLDLANRSFVKAELYRELGSQTGRSVKSIERKFQNISAVLDELGRPWIRGLAPLPNYQKLLANVIGARSTEIRKLDGHSAQDGFPEAGFFLEDPPDRIARPDELPAFMKELFRRFDPVERDMRNRKLGEEGERLVLEHETSTLRLQGHHNLAKNVRWVAKEEGDGAGYDILSFDGRGEKKYIEVKTTIGGNRTPFFVTRNEYAFANAKCENYHLIRLFEFSRTPRAFEIEGMLQKFVRLSTEVYRAEFRA